MIKARLFSGAILVGCAILAGLLLHGRHAAQECTRGEIPAKFRVVRALSLTDLAIWTEARYTRHPSQADFFTSFQDFPSSLEHFPAGSVMGPSLRRAATT